MTRKRATKAQMEERYSVLIELAYEHGPCSVRHVYYRAVVIGLVPKNRSGYGMVQRGLLHLRREGEIDYGLIVDGTRWVTRPDTWTDPEEVLRSVARTYRRDLWHYSDYQPEVWCESDSIKGTIHAVADRWAVPIYTCRGQTSETFAYQAVEDWHARPERERIILYIGDHDPAGLEIESSLIEKLDRFNDDLVEYRFSRLAVKWSQVEAGDLPGSPPKKEYGYPLAVEAEALPPNELRELLDTEIERYADLDQLRVIQAAEASEREIWATMQFPKAAA